VATEKYEVTEAGLEWAQAMLPNQTVEKDKSYELDLNQSQRKAVVAAGWLVPKKGN
jgi:hypothetical protein